MSIRRRLSLVLAVAALALAVPLLAQQPPTAAASGETPAGQTPPSAVPPHPEGAPVTVDGQVLFRVYSALGPLTAEDRARLAEERIVRIAGDPFYSDELITTKDEGQRVLIYYRGNLVGIATASESAMTGHSPQDEAALIVRVVKAAIHSYRERRLPAERVRGWIILGVATALLAALLLALRNLNRRLAKRVEERARAGQSIWIQRIVALSAEKAAPIQIRLLRLGRALLTIIIVPVYLETAFVFLPLTKGYALGVLDYLLAPVVSIWHGFLAHVGDLFFILVILILTRYFLKLVRWLMVEAAEGAIVIPGVPPEWAMALYKSLRAALIAVAAVIVYPYIPGSSTAAFKGISLFAGALFTLGASGAAGNLIGGLVLIFMDAFRAGDRVKVGDVVGDVVDTTFTVTRLRTPKNEIVTIPNGKIMSGDIVNYSAKARGEGVILHTSVTIGYDAPWRTVHELLIRAARATQGTVAEPPPFVLQRALNDFYVDYEINVYTRAANRMLEIYGELHQNIQDAFNEGGVEIMSPHYASLRDGNAPTIPDAQRPRDYPARTFGVHLDEPGGRGREGGSS